MLQLWDILHKPPGTPKIKPVVGTKKIEKEKEIKGYHYKNNQIPKKDRRSGQGL